MQDPKVIEYLSAMKETHEANMRLLKATSALAKAKEDSIIPTQALFEVAGTCMKFDKALTKLADFMVMVFNILDSLPSDASTEEVVATAERHLKLVKKEGKA